jgi:glyoxylase-like metal-dependent hydrolase (beta-lactamase superfamily II)
VTTLNDHVDWSAELGGGVRVALIQAGRFRSDAGALLGVVPRMMWKDLIADEIDADQRLLQALNCLLIETPSGRVLVETGIGDRISDKGREMRRYEGPWIVPALEAAGFAPDSVDAVAVSHLHYDHAGGVLRADGSLAFPRARFVAQLAEWEIALGLNPRLIASYDQPELRLIRDLGLPFAAEGGVEILPGVSVFPTGGHSAGHQGVLVRGRDMTVAFFGDLCMRPWSANPKWVTAFDDFPLDSVAVKAALFARAAAESWTVVLSHEPVHPVGCLVRDRDRYSFEPTV